ncbi:MAG: ice-binding family protein [Ferruginibacter sp.]
MNFKLLRMLTVSFLLLLTKGMVAQTPVMGSTAGYVLFTSTGAVTNTGISQITGNVGTNTTGGAITGFGNVNGNLQIGNAATLLASNELTLLYTELNTAISTGNHAPLLGNGETLTAGVYAVSGLTTLSDTLNLDAQGDPNAVFIFQVSAPFSSTTSAYVNLLNGALACNVFWKVEGAVSIGSLTTMRGTIVANNDAVDLGAGVTLEGRAFSTTGAITLNGTLAYIPTGCGSPVLSGPAAPVLGSAGCYALFSGNENVTNAGVSYVTGDIGTNVGLTTGFDPLNVNGTIHPIPDGSTSACATDLLVAYNYLNLLPADIELIYPDQFGRGLVLTPHTYLLNAATSFTDSLYLNAAGNPDAVFVMKIYGALSTSTFSKVILINGAQAKNVYWLVNGAVGINDYSIFNGTIVCNNGAVSLTTGVTVNGRALTTNGAFSTAAVVVNGPLGDCSTLPVTWLSFTAEKIAKTSVLLKWSTSNEINNDHFDIQRSSDGINFTDIGSVPAATNSGTVRNYSYTDSKANAGYNYYRIRQVDRDGHAKYSVIVQVTVNRDQWSVFPNPATTRITVRFPEELNNAVFTLIDNTGKKVYSQSRTIVNAGELIDLPLNNLTRGIYLLKINSDKDLRTEKIIVQ